jgi:hypothetical protein
MSLNEAMTRIDAERNTTGGKTTQIRANVNQNRTQNSDVHIVPPHVIQIQTSISSSDAASPHYASSHAKHVTPSTGDAFSDIRQTYTEVRGKQAPTQSQTEVKHAQERTFTDGVTKVTEKHQCTSIDMQPKCGKECGGSRSVGAVDCHNIEKHEDQDEEKCATTAPCSDTSEQHAYVQAEAELLSTTGAVLAHDPRPKQYIYESKKSESESFMKGTTYAHAKPSHAVANDMHMHWYELAQGENLYAKMSKVCSLLQQKEKGRRSLVMREDANRIEKGRKAWRDVLMSQCHEMSVWSGGLRNRCDVCVCVCVFVFIVS